MMDDAVWLAEVYDPEHPQVFNNRMVKCVEQFSDDDWNNTLQQWFPNKDEVLVYKNFVKDESTMNHYCTDHNKTGLLHTEVEIIKYDEFIKLLKYEKSYCRICSLILLTGCVYR
jgi:hypothetical protein